MGIQKTPYQKTYELQTRVQDFTVDFQGANRQFGWIEILLFYDKSDKQLTLYDSYNVECAVRMVKSLKFPIISEQYSATNTLKYDTANDLQKHLLWKQFMAWHTNGCSNAPVTDFINNPVAQELLDETNYFSDSSDERLYVDLIRRSPSKQKQ